MKEITIQAPAKINLFLEVLGKRGDGYHEIETVMAPVGLFDQIIVRQGTGKPGLSLSCSADFLACDSRNIAYRAAQAVYSHLGITDFQTEIIIEKKISVGAGLAGGSTDAAAVLLAVNELNGSKLTRRDLLRLGAALGADVPFCMTGKSMLARGIGERMSPAPQLPPCFLIIAKDGSGASTKEAYAALDAIKRGRPHRADALIAAMQENNLQEMGRWIYNAFEEVVLPIRPKAAALKAYLLKQDCVFAQMSGSGTAVFAVFDQYETARRALNRLQAKGCPEAVLCRPCSGDILSEEAETEHIEIIGE